MKKIFAAILGMTAAAALLASCSGNTESDAKDRDENRTTTVTTTGTSRTTTGNTVTTEDRRTVSDNDSGSFMSQAESKLDELGEDAADGIDTALSTAGDVADAILR